MSADPALYVQNKLLDAIYSWIARVPENSSWLKNLLDLINSEFWEKIRTDTLRWIFQRVNSITLVTHPVQKTYVMGLIEAARKILYVNSTSNSETL